MIGLRGHVAAQPHRRQHVEAFYEIGGGLLVARHHHPPGAEPGDAVGFRQAAHGDEQHVVGQGRD